MSGISGSASLGRGPGRGPGPVPTPQDDRPRRSPGCRLIVLTGGPGAGKTAVLETVRRSFDNIAVLPDAAGIVFGGGFWRRQSVSGRKAAQRAIFHVQRELERLITEEGSVALALCDRGTLDGLAYWPEDAASFFAETGVEREAELARYGAVIHLRTPAIDSRYEERNSLQLEKMLDAQAIDNRIALAWEGHPNRVFIESSTDFFGKALRAVMQIKANLPACYWEPSAALAL